MSLYFDFFPTQNAIIDNLELYSLQGIKYHPTI